jgi:hypothetical protein
MRSVPISLAVLLLAGCPPPPRYSVQRPADECHRATRVAHRTMVELGYDVTEMVEATGATPGYVVGSKTGADGKPMKGSVRISCTASGVTLQPIENQFVPDFEFSRAFGYSYKSLVQRPDVESPVVESGLQILVERVDRYEAGLDLGSNPVVGDAVLVRVTVRNGTDREVAVNARDIELLAPDGSSTPPLARAAASAALSSDAAGAEVRSKLLDRKTVRGGVTEAVYLLYPSGTYRETLIAVEDVETGETEGFQARVQ